MKNRIFHPLFICRRNAAFRTGENTLKHHSEVASAAESVRNRSCLSTVFSVLNGEFESVSLDPSKQSLPHRFLRQSLHLPKALSPLPRETILLCD